MGIGQGAIPSGERGPLDIYYQAMICRGGEVRMASSVNLGDKLEAAVARLVSAGRYNSRSEVLREGVRLIDERETKLAAFSAAIQVGIDAADAGDVYDIDEVFDYLDAKYAAMAEAAARPRAPARKRA
jgi:antitoxin ParD1/3/4